MGTCLLFSRTAYTGSVCVCVCSYSDIFSFHILSTNSYIHQFPEFALYLHIQPSCSDKTIISQLSGVICKLQCKVHARMHYRTLVASITTTIYHTKVPNFLCKQVTLHRQRTVNGSKWISIMYMYISCYALFICFSSQYHALLYMCTCEKYA